MITINVGRCAACPFFGRGDRTCRILDYIPHRRPNYPPDLYVTLDNVQTGEYRRIADPSVVAPWCPLQKQMAAVTAAV